MIPSDLPRGVLAAALLAAALLTGCVPYTVATTAQPAPQGEWTNASIVYAIPNGVSPEFGGGDEFGEAGASFIGADTEMRLGLDDRSDFGIRVPGGAGAVMTYKRRVAGDADGPALAVMGGGGFINFANHVHFELTAIASGREEAQLTPYGGLRAMQAIPLSAVAPSDAPTLGGFAGLRVGPREMGVSLEVGLFYDPSATGIREQNWIIVPAFTLHRRGFGRLFPF